MKRLGRWLFNLAAVVSLVTCAVLILGGSSALSFERSVTWPFGYYGPHRFMIQLDNEDLILMHRTRLNLMQLTEADPNAVGMYRPIDNRVLRYDQMLGEKLPGRPEASSSLYVDYLLSIPMTLILPLVWLGWVLFRSYVQSSRQRAGLCTGCGYDLRATPERCPECGAVPPATEAPAT